MQLELMNEKGRIRFGTVSVPVCNGSGGRMSDDRKSKTDDNS